MREPALAVVAALLLLAQTVRITRLAVKAAETAEQELHHLFLVRLCPMQVAEAVALPQFYVDLL